MRVYETVLLGGRLQNSSEEALMSAIRLAVGGIAFVLLLAGAVSLINSRIMDRAITDRIQKLRDGAVVIGGGDLNHSIDLTGDDEFSDLSATFNTMTSKLRVSYKDLEQKIEERRQAEGALQDSEERFRAVFESSSDCILVWDRQCNYLYANQAAIDHVGTTRDKVVGKNIRDGLGHVPYFMHMWMARVEQAFATGEPFRVEDAVSVSGRLVYSESQISPIRDASGQVFAVSVVYRDVTARKKAEEDILKLNEDMAARNVELEFLNKELEAFIFSISHDLRAPIRSMASFARFLVEDYTDKLDGQGHDYLTRINRGAEKMTRLIEDLLRLSKISRQEIIPAVIGLSKMASSIAEALHEANPGRNIAFSIKDGLTAEADTRLMEIVLSNLLENAWKFTSRKDKAHIDFGSFQRDGKTVYYVRDDGAGFDQTHVEKIFWPFHRLHADTEFEGTGIGLSIVERIIHRHGGRIWAEAEVGKGTTIYFALK